MSSMVELVATVFVTLWIITLSQVNGDCSHNGMTYMKNTIWQPDACSVCTCDDPIVVCEKIQCLDPQCDYSKGEYLQIPAGGCCPKCVHQLSTCTHNQHTIQHNTEWEPEPCLVCRCYDGQVTCGKQPCPPTRCKPGEVIQNLPGQCCPQCIPAGRSCTHGGQHHQDGAEWEDLPCTKCVCRDGQVSCYPRQCPPVVCSQTERFETMPGTCCPQCIGNNTCRENNQEYRTGDQWSRDPCNLCICMGGTVVCTQKECGSSLPCQQNERRITRQGECCSECVSTERPCSAEVPVRYSGEIWNRTSCDYCVCDSGQVQCHTASCEHAQCAKDEIQVHLAGSCCPQCVVPPHCDFAGQSYQNGDTWHPDSCSVCNCHNKEVTCYTTPCPACSEGSFHINRPGECCGECHKVECNAACARCIPDNPAYCTLCESLGDMVDDGTCARSCRTGFFPGKNGHCKACHSSCHTCVEETQYHCATCQPGLLWRHGECVTQCGAGYYLQNGKCLECDSSCKSCSGPNKNQCSSCANMAQVVHQGRCLDYCPDNYYVNGGICLSCPSTCRTCTPDGAGCASCWIGGLLHERQCVILCPVGFYPNSDGSCSVCHPSCDSCDGGSSSDCVSCAGGARLKKKGKCRSQCPKGSYLAYDGSCKDCENGCSQCHLTYDGRMSVCSDCEDADLVPSGNECLSECRIGQYQEHKVCKACGANCLECTGAASCTKCDPSMLLLRGQCVEYCGQAQYEDGMAMECKDCAKDCIHCYSGEECVACNSLSFLRGGRCVRECGPGYIGNIDKRLCERNTAAPTFQILKHVQVPEGSGTTLTSDLFFISDPDAESLGLRVMLVTPPDNGYLVRVVDGEDVKLGTGDNFSVQEMLEGKVRFFHDILGNGKGKARFHVTDGQLNSVEQDLYFQAMTSVSVTLKVNKLLHVTGGERTPVGPEALDFNVKGSPSKLKISVIEGPKEGLFMNQKRNIPVTSFTLEELRSSLIMYSHNPRGTAGSDVVLLQASDGYTVLSLIFHMEIRAKENLKPMLLNNGVGHVVMGQSVEITPELLMAKVMDVENVQSDEIIYTLVPPLENPREGELLMVVPVPPSGVGRGWEAVGAGKMAARMSRFLQRDINEGRIFYRHKGTQTTSDIIKFEVADTATPPNVLQNQVFTLRVLEDQHYAALAEPTLAPGVKLGMTVLENQLMPLTSVNMAYRDGNSIDSEIIYTITKHLGENQGILENIENPFKAVRRFTQDDINNNRIIYRPPEGDIGHREMEVSFNFIVTDNQNSRSVQEQTFTIRIIPVNNMPPRFTSLITNVVVSQGGTVPVGQTVLGINDPDTPTDDLTVNLAREPVHGKFEKVQGDSKAVIRSGDSFTVAEVNQNLFQYSHDRSDSPLSDSLQLSVSDGAHDTTATLNITVLKVDKSAPYMLPSSSCRITVQEGSTVVIERSHLSFVDADDNDDGLTIVLAQATAHGKLLLNQRQILQGETSSQTDINNGYLSYSADTEIGQKEITEILIFNVTDRSNNLLPNQILSVLIQPVDNRPPRVRMGPQMQVTEGAEVNIKGSDLTVTDMDTTTHDLVVVMETQPAFGDVMDKAPVEGSESLESRLVTSFPLQDLLDGYLFYAQNDHKNKEPVEDGFLFHVTDGTNRSPTNRVNISILLVNDEVPQILTEQVFAQEGQPITVTNASVYVIDLDTAPKDLVFTITVEPVHGSLKKKEFMEEVSLNAAYMPKGSVFTYRDILNELIIYQHDGSEVTTDSFTLTLTDGDYNDTKTVSIVVGLVNDETPRVTINRGLRVYSGSVTPVKSQDLRSTDVDSDNSKLIYTITKDPSVGRLTMNKDGRRRTISSSGRLRSFTQTDIDTGTVEYRHTLGDATGNVFFKFTVSDPEGNDLIDQDFYITILEDRLPPKVISNKELLVSEGGTKRITTDFLSFTDDDSEPSSLRYEVLTAPRLGHLEIAQNPGVPVTEFTQSDLAANSLLYIHTSKEEKYTDRFTFSVTDGNNEVTRTFLININPVDDSIPIVVNNGLKVQEGIRKVITEFDLRAVDKDTKEESVVFKVVQPPLHGDLELQRGENWVTTTIFTMADIYENHVSYQHDGSETVEDNFSFTVSDGTNDVFAMQQDGGNTVPQSSPQGFSIKIIPTDDGSPILEKNLGLQFLESTGEQVSNIISAEELRASDVDTSDDRLMFVIMQSPQHGRLENTASPGIQLHSFTQDDINKGAIRYVLTDNDGDVVQDSFTFDLVDTRPNRVSDNMFHIMWPIISLGQPHFNVTETAGIISVPVVRKGNLKQYSVVTCGTVPGSAHARSHHSQPGGQDYMEKTVQIQFDEWQDTKVCTIVINDDSIFEGPEEFYVELTQPTFALLGTVAKATVAIYDLEDEPILQFKDSVFHVNESDGYLMAAITRTGDMSSSVSVVCSTMSMTARGSSLNALESGSDYVSRGSTNSYRVVFPPGIGMATCDVQMIDDSDSEPSEQFELQLSVPSFGARLGPIHKATVVIDGPNDESVIHFSAPKYHFDENAGIVDLEVLREGTDLNHNSMVWCATRLSHPPSATPGQDYVPSSSQLSFGPGQSSQKCHLTILDDDIDPRMEGNETFTVFLSSAMGSSLNQPYIATVMVQDSHLDVPALHFGETHYTVDEKDKLISVPVLRSGDLSFESSVICYTRQNLAQVMMDYDERTLSEASRVVFKPGDKVKNCTVGIVDDEDFEPDEEFYLRLTQPQGTANCPATLGLLNMTVVTITNENDVPRVQFEKSAYSVQEPSSSEQITTVVIHVIRTGDITKPASVRCSTRDGSAMSGVDYNPRSQILQFNAGVRSMDFPVDVLYNSDIEWHEAFSIILGPDDPVGVQLGAIKTASITILDNDVSGSLVLPAAPIVVSLLMYDKAKDGIKIDPSPGYPLVCITPCDIHYPTYSVTHTLCQEANINQTTVYYRWEVAMPPDGSGIRPPFVEISDRTPFTSVNSMVLDSIYFRPSFSIRCVAQPVHENGNPGIPLKSKPVSIGRDNGICNAPVFSGHPFSYGAQSFLAKMDYIGSGDIKHPNTIHINIQVPHQDGMLPLISTYPLHNLRFLLAEPIYRQQHVCSNIVTPKELDGLLDSKAGFLDNHTTFPQFQSSGYDFPFQFNRILRGNETLMLYKHLNLKSCLWTFEAWFHMTDLVDICGGRAVSDFQVTDGGQTYLTVRVPLYVSYLYATAPIGWGSLEHRTEMEFSFYYDTILWRSGLETEGELGGKIQVMRIVIGEDGKLVIDFRTQAKYRGVYVLEHSTLPGYTSRVIGNEKDVSFDLDLLWSQNTFDGPHQLWRATSQYSLKDYTGEYTVELIPCTVQSTQRYTPTTPVPCTAHQPQRFQIPIAFQQTNRPVPLMYTLNTHFQVTNNEKVFLMDPKDLAFDLEEMDFNGAFLKGQKLYGRVLWNPEQDLKDAYKLNIEKVFLCTGRDGYVPTYDPTGEVYNEGPQYGCIQPGSNLRYRFLILDRGSPDVVTKAFQNVPFHVELAEENSDYSPLLNMPGVDGFVMSVDPLYKVTTGYQWYLQIIYTIGPSDPNLQRFRNRRSAVISLGKRDVSNSLNERTDWIENNKSKNGTNIKVLHLNYKSLKSSQSTSESNSPVVIILPILLVLLIIICAIIVFLILRKRRRKNQKVKKTPKKRNNLEIAEQNSVIYRANLNKRKSKGSSRTSVELKNTAVYQSELSRTPSVRVKDTNLEANKDKKESGTEV